MIPRTGQVLIYFGIVLFWSLAICLELASLMTHPGLLGSLVAITVAFAINSVGKVWGLNRRARVVEPGFVISPYGVDAGLLAKRRTEAGEAMEIAILIPAFEPDHKLVSLVAWISASPVAAVVVIDDGSGPEYAQYFERLKKLPKVHLLRHAVNLGKGAALKSGINYALCEFPDCQGVATADADGQHHPEDILKVAERLCAQPRTLVLGVRDFGSTVPFRSRLGNQLTKGIMYLVTGQRIADTQTGLRGIPRSLMPRLLKIPASGYQFELEMLIACKHTSRTIVEEKIRTIYIGANETSHFNPLLDSMRIYFTLFRFSIVSLITAVIDNATFYFMLQCSLPLGLAQATGRLVAVLFNYTGSRKAVFLSPHAHRMLLPRYLCVVVGSGMVSYGLIRYLTSSLHFGVIPAKLLVESMLFLFNFAVLRDFVFTRNAEDDASSPLDGISAAKPVDEQPRRVPVDVKKAEWQV